MPQSDLRRDRLKLALRGLRALAIVAVWTAGIFSFVIAPGWRTALAFVLALSFASFPRWPVALGVVSAAVVVLLSPLLGAVVCGRLALQVVAAWRQAHRLQSLRAAARTAEATWRREQVIGRNWAKEEELYPELTLAHDDMIIDGLIFAVFRGWVGMRMSSEFRQWLQWTLRRLGVGAGERAARERAGLAQADAYEPLAEAIGGSLGTRLLMRPMFFEWLLSNGLFVLGVAVVAIQAPRWTRWELGDYFFALPYLLGFASCWFAFRAGQKRRRTGLLDRGFQLVVAYVLTRVGHLSGLHSLVIPFACGYCVARLQRWKDSRLDRLLPGESTPFVNLVRPGDIRLLRQFGLARRRDDETLVTARKALETLAQTAPPARPALAAWAEARLAQGELQDGALESARLRLGRAEQLLTPELAGPSAAHAEVSVLRARLRALAGDSRAALSEYEAAAATFAELEAWHAAAVTDHEMVLPYAQLGDAEGAERVAARARDVLARYFDIAYILEDAAAIARLYRERGQAARAKETIEKTLEFVNMFSESKRLLDRVFPSFLAVCTEHARAASALRDKSAVEMFDEIEDMFEESGAHVPELLRSDFTIGFATAALAGDVQRATDLAVSGLERLERIRGGVRASEYRGGMLLSLRRLYREGIGVLSYVASQGDQRASRSLLGAIESLKRDGLAQLLRTGSFALEGDMRGHLEALLAVDQAQAIAAAGTRGLARDDHESGGEREGHLRELATGLSETFASVIDPQPVDVDALLDSLAQRHALVLYVADRDSERWEGVSVWVTPTRSLVSKRWQLARGGYTAEAFVIAEALSQGDDSVLWEDMGEGWKQLGELLFPELLARTLDLSEEIVDLIIVPSAELAALPFAALRPRKRPLIESCRPTIVPSISILSSRQESSVGKGEAVVFLSQQLRADEEKEAWRTQERFSVVSAGEGRTFVEALRGSEPRAVAYIAAHGSAEGTGLSHRIDLDGVELSAGAALGLNWPEVVVLASCWVSRIELQPGHEPFGLPVACMLRGARVVIGGIAPVSDETAGPIMRDVIGGLAAGAAPAEALRRAQADHIASAPGALPGEWAAYQVMAR